MVDLSGAKGDLKERSAALFRQGNLEAAKELLDRLIRHRSEDSEALFMRAGILTKQGSWDEAYADLAAILRAEPNNYECLVLMGLVLKNQGHFEKAIRLLRKAIAIEPSNASGYNTLGMCLLSMREIEKAVQAFQQAVEREPSSGAIYQNLGLALKLNEKRHQALDAFRKAAELSPENPSNFLSLAHQLRRMGLKVECVQILEVGRRKHSHSLPVLLALAQAYGDTNRTEEAETLFMECLKLDPSAVQALAVWLQQEGRFGESIERLQHSVEDHPNQGAAYLSLAEAKEYRLSDGSRWADRIPALLEDPRLSRSSRMYLWYALARARENEGEYESAMQAFDAANALAYAIYNEGRPFDFSIGRRVTARTVSLYSAGELARIRSFGSSSVQPIFIVGMIRSGTTILDQILSSHSQVKPAGECEFWMEESDHLYARWQQGVNLDDLPNLAERYLRRIEAEGGNSPHITDKMPLNYQHLGHIHAAFPNAKILHIRRHPIDTCLSIYATHFGSGPHFAYKKRNIVFYYQEYLRLMEHWRQILPAEVFFELDYEELVNDQERVVKDLLAFCDLPWEEPCLHPEQNALRISTPSRWQARQPIYKTSIEKWKGYEPWLAEFSELKFHSIQMQAREAVNHAVWLQRQGRFAEAETCLTESIEMDPTQGSAYLALAEASLLSADDGELIQRLIGLSCNPNSDLLNQIYASYAIAKAYDRSGNFQEATKFFVRANGAAFELFNGGRNFHPATAKGYPEKIAKIYSKKALRQMRHVGSEDDKPILIVGMIRSGTTLLDQIVTSHSQVASAGELPFWKVVGDRFNRKWYDDGIEEAVWPAMQAEYLAVLARESGGAPRITDKMPLNFELLGMFHLAFPNAKILHIRRNPADTLLSIYQNYYGPGPNFAYNWDNLLTYYEAYRRFMELWREILPAEVFLEVDYEALVTDSEKTIRSVIHFLDLPWEDVCLHPEKNQGPVDTPSKWQVRQPLYQSSIEKWRNYAPFMPQLSKVNELKWRTWI